jgi:hypothetical protein
MRDIKQGGRPSAVQMLGENAAGIINRHVIASETDHSCTVFTVQRVKRHFQQFRRLLSRIDNYSQK